MARRDVMAQRSGEQLDYALRLARVGRIAAHGHDIDAFDDVAPFRLWLLDQVERVAPAEGGGEIDWAGLHLLLPRLRGWVERTRSALLRRHEARLGEPDLERELRERQLVLALGGGGGSGYAHLGLFAVIAELGINPALMVGSSMGALMGLFRSLVREYDAVAMAFALPGPSAYPRIFSPYRGDSRFGFPGAFELKLRGVAEQLARETLGHGIPPFAELPIPLRVIATGLRTGINLALSSVEEEIGRANKSLTPLAMRRRMGLLFGVMRTMVDNPRFLSRIVFGGDDDLRDFDVIDAVGFSCAVPGMLHYDCYDPGTASARTLTELCSDRHYVRLTDGGIVSNVPARAAWDAVQEGDLGSRNAFILGLDAFAPLPQHLPNLPFFPAQRLAARFVALDRPFTDYLVTWRQPPSPLDLLQSNQAREKTLTRSRQQLAPLRPLLELALRRLPPWPALRDEDAGAHTYLG